MCLNLRLSNMECSSVISRTVKHCSILCIVLLLIDNVVTQSVQNRGVAGFGLPLPLLKEGQAQGQSAVSFSSDSTFQPSNSPLIVKFDDDSIVNPSTVGVRSGVGVGGGHPDVLIPKVAGSLQLIRNPSEDIGVRSLLNHPSVVKTIQKETKADSALKVDSVIMAHKQVVSGMITYLDIKVVETKCPVGTRNVVACEVDTSEDPFICEVAVWRRAWLNSTKVIDEKTRCAEIESDNDFKNWNRGHSVLRRRRDEITLRSLPQFLDPKQVALEAFDYLDKGSESKFKGHLVNFQIGTIKHDSYSNITTMDVKVEYGFTLCLKFPNRRVDGRICPLDAQRENYICSVKVMSDPNLTSNLKVVPEDDEDIDCEKKQSMEEELVVPVVAVCMGCPQAISLNDPSVLRIAEFAVTDYDRRSDDKELHVMLRLNKAYTQAVHNGIRYYLTLELAETDCHKPLSAFNMNRTLCNIDRTEEEEICEMVVLEQPWQKSMQMVSDKCYDKNHYPSFHRDEFIVPVLGTNQPPHSTSGFTANPTLGATLISSGPTQDSINFVLQEFNRREVDDDDDGFYKVINVIHSSSSNDPRGQVDHIIVELGETICTRRSNSGNCPLKIGEDVEVCSASVLKGTPSRILSMSCDDKDDHYRLTSNPIISRYQPVHQPFFAPHSGASRSGKPIQHPINSSIVQDIARFVVIQYNLQSDDDELYKISKIISAYTLSTDDRMFTIELELLETECKKYQPVVDVSRCPVEPREEAEVCQAEVSISGPPPGTKHLRRIFCDERETFYVKKMTQTHKISPSSSSNNGWKTEPVTSANMKRFGELIADEFDARSDEDNIFVLVKVLEARTQSTGLTHLLKVELAETVCPKYKRGINKTRCAIDIGEESKFCDATLSERPWKNDVEVHALRCMERDDSIEEDESAEVYYPRVHPSAHARPKFPKSQFRVRLHSRESDESNEKYYHPRVGGHPQEGERFDSDEYRSPRPRHPAFDDDEEDSDHRHDNDSRSVENHPRRSRFRRQTSSILAGGSSPVDVNDNKVLDIANFALDQEDQFSADPFLRRVENVVEASRKVVAGWLWSLKIRVSHTNCLKTDHRQFVLTCEQDQNKPIHICDITVWEKPWQKFIEVQEFECSPDTSTS